MSNMVKKFAQAQGGMQKGNITKYKPYPLVDLPDRQWPSRSIVSAPIWCSVDLRDGNQALPTPMGIKEKLEMFKLLVNIGFKEIEVGFPSASQIEFDFIRRLIDENLIPDDVTIQVITQAREELITRTFEAIRGAKRVILHLYNSTSPAQRRLVFGLDKAGITGIATRGTRIVKDLVATVPETEIIYQYSPESFVLTELDYALEICEAVMDVWQPTPDKKMILNLPETVQISTPNVYADQIEWFLRNMKNRESVIMSVHTHNDRGTGVASSELSLMAGAERVEGTLFGNGERTGNVDIVTLALNMYMQGVDPKLDFSNIKEVAEVYKRCTRMDIHDRHPYAGSLVFTAFSGSHQDAINKGMAALDPTPGALWEVPYLPIDPKDIGCSYEAIIRINSQSGKGGVAYIMESEYGFQLPKEMRIEFGKAINAIADERGEELQPQEIYQAFEREYLQRTSPFKLEGFHSEEITDGAGNTTVECIARISVDGNDREIRGQGNGPIDAFVRAINEAKLADFKLVSYSEHSLDEGAEARAVAYIQIQMGDGRNCFGAAIGTDIKVASINAVLSAINRSQA
ncbi:2-isopropylmalate synthase [Thermosporothrix hazakensis]|uniref:2-isopropylmalate synthase n=3 Tax=Thermosporothrix TaxID=768650 RepID=A0A326UD09_THEHA|nr:2-isopropylmalate synthase [Thermosporothrix hazakensis]PZW34519.1 2-isopropylmalate synthase [Thermosporothrix hazakensis]BBH85642.1 2-isopropylmalate synthase [Thermosporothrix sp. COM3]GCE45929.1 2-isopropylmalate synthase [Thermosporothrix hazakensis]